MSRQQSQPMKRTRQSIGGTARDTANVVWPLRSSLELGALPAAVPCARLHARQLAWEWGLDSRSALLAEVISGI